MSLGKFSYYITLYGCNIGHLSRSYFVKGVYIKTAGKTFIVTASLIIRLLVTDIIESAKRLH